MNRRTGIVAMIVAVPLLLAVFYTGPAVGADGKAIFLAQKCDMCHSVASAGIESKNSKADPSACTIAAHDAAWIQAYITKQVDKDGKKHMKEVKGSPEGARSPRQLARPAAQEVNRSGPLSETIRGERP